MAFVRVYETYNKDEHCKRLINLNKALKFYKSKFVKSRKKNKGLKALGHAKRVLDIEEYNSYKLYYKYFKVDGRFHILNANKDLLKYDCTNLYFIFHYLNKSLKSSYADWEKAKFKIGSNDMLGHVMFTMLQER